jgi:hypothetical protein
MLPGRVIVSLFAGIETITSGFPGLCSDFYQRDLINTDNFLHQYGEFYPRLRKHFIRSIENLAHSGLNGLIWDFGWFAHFSAGDTPDLGVRALELSADLFRSQEIDCQNSGVDADICRWFIGELRDSPYVRQISLLRCFWTFLTYAKLPDNTPQYHAFFLELVPILNEVIAAGEFTGMVGLALHIVLWFEERNLFLAEDLWGLTSLTDLQESLYKLFQDGHAMFSDSPGRFAVAFFHRIKGYFPKEWLQFPSEVEEQEEQEQLEGEEEEEEEEEQLEEEEEEGQVEVT